MFQSMERALRRIALMIGRGRITTSNDSGNVQLLQVQLGQDEIRDNTPRLAEYGFTSMPPNGSDALVVFIGGERSNGAIVATGHQASRMKNLKTGEVAIFDDQGQSVYLTRSGIIIEGAGMPIMVNGDVIVNGDVTANGISLKHHKHPGVQAGGASTGEPT